MGVSLGGWSNQIPVLGQTLGTSSQWNRQRGFSFRSFLGGLASCFHGGQALWDQRKSSKPDPSGVKDGISDGGCDPHDRSFASPR
jgi:hypothetical protein